MSTREKNNKGIFVKLTEQERDLYQKVAKYYGVTVADIVRISVMEFIRNHGLEKLLS